MVFGGASHDFSSFYHEFIRTSRPFLFGYCVSIFTLLISLPVSAKTGTYPDIIAVFEFARVLAILFILLMVVVIVVKFILLAVVEKPDRPTLALTRWGWHQLTREKRLYNLSHMLLMTGIFLLGFAVLKGAIAVLHPFSWDETLRDWDKALHFGFLPHEWLPFIMESPKWISFFNLFYNLWFFILLSSLILAGCFASRHSHHARYLVSFTMLWLVAGFFIATAFSSAGPCFFERAGFGDDYSKMMVQLNVAAQTEAVWALATQNLLWDGFVGTRDGSVGISAFPSLHVGTATLLALYAGSRNWLWGILGWTFAIIIMIGSVVLAWHYAVDGYAGAFFAIIIWALVPKLPFMQA